MLKFPAAFPTWLPKPCRAVLNVQFSLANWSGQLREIAANTSRVEDENENTLGVVVIFGDITESIDLKEQVRRSSLMISLGEMAAGLAHEIRNGLTGIIGYATMLSESLAEGTEKNYAKAAVDEARNLSEIMNNFLLFARKSKLSTVETTLGQLAEETLALLKREMEAKGVQIKWGSRPAELPVEVDPPAIKQAILNILLNALQACTKGDYIEISNCTEGEMAVLKIRDTGCGMSKAELERVFEPFYTTKTKGVGLGMPVTYRIILDHRGIITIDSEPGLGTVVTVKIPGKRGENADNNSTGG